MKKILILSLCFLCSLSLIPYRYTFANESTEQKTCPVGTKPTVTEELLNESNHLIKKYDNGVEVEYIEENVFIIRDYKNIINNEIPESQPRSWIMIGIAILKYTYYAVTACQFVQYVMGHDICRIVTDYVADAYESGTFEYELTGQYIDDTKPGCEPAHSWQCNGYWEYRVELI